MRRSGEGQIPVREGVGSPGKGRYRLGGGGLGKGRDITEGAGGESIWLRGT